MAVRAVFKQDFFVLRKFLSGLVFIEAVSSTAYACGLYSENEIIVTQTKLKGLTPTMESDLIFMPLKNF